MIRYEGLDLHAEGGGTVNTEGLDRRVLDAQALDPGVGERVGVEEPLLFPSVSRCGLIVGSHPVVHSLGLRLSTVATLAVPPSGTTAIDNVTRGTLDSDLLSGDRDQGALPLLVAERSSTGEGDSRAGREASQVEGGTGRDGDAVEDNAGAARLALDGTGSVGEGAASTLVENGGRSLDRGGHEAEGGRERGNGGNHDDLSECSTQ